jgi:FAD:protein FMN transferase
MRPSSEGGPRSKTMQRNIRPASHFILPGLFVTALFAALVARRPQGPQLYEFSGQTMGTTWMLKMIADPVLVPVGKTRTTVLHVLESTNQKMSTYITDSEVSLFNSSRSTTAFPVSTETIEVVEEANRISVLTGGAFDVTISPLVEAWGFGVGEAEEPPTAETIALYMPSVGYEQLKVNRQTSSIQKMHPDLTIDLSAIAKGYAVDQVAGSLDALGIRHYMIEVGGEIRTSGNKGTEAWKVGIEQPQADKGSIEEIVVLERDAIATSGDYRNYYELGGTRISHTIDGRTGRPIEHQLASVSVIHASAMTADAWATALNVLGPEEGMKIAEQEKLPVFMLLRRGDDFEMQMTEAFQKYRVNLATNPVGEKQ